MSDQNYYEFTIEFISERGDSDEILTELFEAGTDDALLLADGTRFTAEFERESGSFAQAIMSAIHAIESVPDCRVIRVGLDDVVSLAEIGRRIGKSREAIRLFAEGKRGPGGFPSRLSEISSQAMWSWAEVSSWLFTTGRITENPVSEAQFLRTINAALELRIAARGVEDPETRAAANEAVTQLLAPVAA